MALPTRQVVGEAHCLPQSTLSEVPGRGTRAMACRAASRTPSVPYFHVVFTLPASARRDRLPEQGVVYAILFRCAAETLTTIAADPKHLGAQLGVTPCSIPEARPCNSCPLCRAWWWTFARRHTLGRLPARLLPAGARPVSAVPPRVSARAASCLRGRPLALLWRSRPPRRSRPVRRAPRSAPTGRLGRLCQAAIQRARTGAGLSQPLYASRRHSQQSADLTRRWQGELFLEGLSAESQSATLRLIKKPAAIRSSNARSPCVHISAAPCGASKSSREPARETIHFVVTHHDPRLYHLPVP